jgi:hypothetical protein
MCETLNKIADLCQASVTVTINPHKDYYQTIGEYLKDQDETVDPDTLNGMYALGRMVIVQAYPITPIGFYVIYHYSIDMALAEMLQTLQER